jgi:hypothetical protein
MIGYDFPFNIKFNKLVEKKIDGNVLNREAEIFYQNTDVNRLLADSR